MTSRPTDKPWEPPPEETEPAAEPLLKQIDELRASIPRWADMMFKIIGYCFVGALVASICLFIIAVFIRLTLWVLWS